MSFAQANECLSHELTNRSNGGRSHIYFARRAAGIDTTAFTPDPVLRHTKMPPKRRSQRLGRQGLDAKRKALARDSEPTPVKHSRLVDLSLCALFIDISHAL